MAKGNDGNYLQHCIEVEAAVRLAEMDAAGRLHIALTHGMKPFESFEERKPSTRDGLLLKKLEDSKKQPQAGEPAVVEAYRKTRASDTRYPNSAELLRVIIGTENLSGGITEICSKKHKYLSEAWLNTNVETTCTSWREEINPDGILACPEDLQSPWLFCMDPMTYSERSCKDENLNRLDIDILSCALSRYFRSGYPGVAALFVYNVGKNNNRQDQYKKFVKCLKKRVTGNLSVRVKLKDSYFSLPHKGGNRNLAGLLHSSEIDLSSNLKSACIEIGIAPGRHSAPRL